MNFNAVEEVGSIGAYFLLGIIILTNVWRKIMAETVLLQEIKKVLSDYPQYWDNEVLLKNRVVEDLRNYQSDLISSLLGNEKIK